MQKNALIDCEELSKITLRQEVVLIRKMSSMSIVTIDNQWDIKTEKHYIT